MEKTFKNFCKKFVPISIAKFNNCYAQLKAQNESLYEQIIKLSVQNESLYKHNAKLSEQNEMLTDMLSTTNKKMDRLKKKLHRVILDIPTIQQEALVTKENTEKLQSCMLEFKSEEQSIITQLKNDLASILSEEEQTKADLSNFKKEMQDAITKHNNWIKNVSLKSSADSKKLQYKMDKYMSKEKIHEALCDWYYEQTGSHLDLQHPKTFNEIIQWTKLYDFDSEKCKLVDKYLVRNRIKGKIGKEYLVPLYGVWDRAEDIDFDKLPQSFVLKCNHGCGYNIIVKDKTSEDFTSIRKKLNDWLHEDFAFKNGFELQYSQIRRRIIAEEYIENADEDLYDYKVFCFNGKAKYIMFLSNRKKGLKMQIYDLDWNLQPFVYSFERNETVIEKPDNLSELIECAEKLAEGFLQVRVDFYRLNDGSWKFGEMTFTSASGVAKWDPPEYDEILGEMIQLNK